MLCAPCFFRFRDDVLLVGFATLLEVLHVLLDELNLVVGLGVVEGVVLDLNVHVAHLGLDPTDPGVELPEGAVAPVTAPAVVALPFIHVVEELDDLLGKLCTACIVLPTPTNSTGHAAQFIISFTFNWHLIHGFLAAGSI